MFVKAADCVARVAPSDSYCLAVERMGTEGMIAIKLTVSGETRTVCFGNSDDKGLYPFLLEEINRFHECFMEEIRNMRMGMKPPASESVFAFRDFYETEKRTKAAVPEDKTMTELKAIKREKGVFCIQAKYYYFCSGCGAELLNHRCSPYPKCPNCYAKIFWFGGLKSFGNANAEDFADDSVKGYSIKAEYKPFICDTAEKRIAKIMTT